MPLCKLCHHDRQLRNSHIVPEFLYENLYNSRHQLMGIHGRGPKGWEILQKGIREHLFCEDCEQHFNKYFEKPFRRQWIENFPLPDPWLTDQVHCIKVDDYVSFKLFHLSVFFRASVSTLPTFAEVSLGPHEERLRRLLLARNPGRPDQYPIFAHAVVRHDTHRIVQMVSRAHGSFYGGRPCYGMMYGGVQWWIRVTSGRHHQYETVALRPDGSMPFSAVPWNEVGVVLEARDALRNSEPSKR